MTKEPSKVKKVHKYFEGVGRRKTSVARVRVFPGGKDFIINGKGLEHYFPTPDLQMRARQSLETAASGRTAEAGAKAGKIGVTVKVSGGGVSSQAAAVAMGLARAISVWEPERRVILKREGLLTRDAREKERRKFGLKKARKAPQWSKR